MGRSSLLSAVCALILLFASSAAQGATIAAGLNHTLAIKADGTLWAWGDNSTGQLGDGSTVSQLGPEQIAPSFTWTAVAAGSGFTIAINSDGTRWAWGDNSTGGLGDGTTTQQNGPEQIAPSLTWTAVAAGSNFAAGIESDGTLWAWGDNASGQLGIGSTGGSSTAPLQEGRAFTWTAVAAGSNFAAGIESDGTLWAWGDNASGQLGIGPGGTSGIPIQISTATNWTAVTAGKDFALALRSDNSLWAWGNNSSGQLGDGGTVQPSGPEQIVPSFTWTAVAAGSNFTVALRADGSLWAWGDNSNGQLGIGSTSGSASPVQVPLFGWTAVAAGSNFIAALRADGTLWAWGNNGSGQLGDGTTVTRTSPEQIFTGFPVSPAVISIVPTSGARNVNTNVTIQATFSEAMDPTTITTAAFSLSGNVTGTVTYDPSTNKATFTPTGHLSNLTVYTATITTDVRDLSGNSLPANFVWSFTTEQKSSHCFIATAAYGSYLDPRVEALRVFRDRYLMTNMAGRYFVDRYYRYSPPFAAVIARHEALRSVTRWALTPLVFGVIHPFLFGVVLLCLAGLSGAALKGRRRPN
ncbi:MAG: CFI-box-CTERM domain-containing protein [Syntrophorhabdales bacterium]|jgi:alpha-tubulin suppressor-like RCC1 family protein